MEDNIEDYQEGEFIIPPEMADTDGPINALPQQEKFWRLPTRFSGVSIEKEPMGWDRRRGFRKLFPVVYLPFQIVKRVSFGHPELEPDRLFWGDNLHVMRQLPSESIDLIYIDPPFFSGRQYSVIFGDQNELRSFSDIWEGGMPGYLIWLNARLYEMKRLLKKTGSIYVHCDWHASHYIKVEIDKIFGYEMLVNEIVWHYNRWTAASRSLQRMHDVILWYARGANWKYNMQFKDYAEGSKKAHAERGYIQRGSFISKPNPKGVAADDVWDYNFPARSSERIGYPTQKPEEILQRVILAASDEGDMIADMFCGGGTTPAVAQRLGRRWIACDQSRVAVAITADRLTRQAEEQTGKILPAFSAPDFTIEYWGDTYDGEFA